MLMIPRQTGRLAPYALAAIAALALGATAIPGRGGASPRTPYLDRCNAPLPHRHAVFSGKVRYVMDGDSLCVGRSGDPSTWIEVRLGDFNAPELREPAGPLAKRTLMALTMGKKLVCTVDHRSYDRVVSLCTLNGRPLGDLMRRRGVPEGGR